MEQLEPHLPAVDLRLPIDVLDRIDEAVALGVTLIPDDNSYGAHEFTPAARRRCRGFPAQEGSGGRPAERRGTRVPPRIARRQWDGAAPPSATVVLLEGPCDAGEAYVLTPPRPLPSSARTARPRASRPAGRLLTRAGLRTRRPARARRPCPSPRGST